jgi:hypothetical protein
VLLNCSEVMWWICLLHGKRDELIGEVNGAADASKHILEERVVDRFAAEL